MTLQPPSAIALSTLAPNSATVAVFGDNLSPNLATVAEIGQGQGLRMGPCSRTWTFPANEIGATGFRRSSVLMMMTTMMMLK